MTLSSPPDPTGNRRQGLIEFTARSRDAHRRERLDRAAGVAIEALRQVGVETLLLKGAALAQTLYAPGHQRSYFDVDLFVAPQTRPAAETVLSELGYRNVTRDQGIHDVTGILHAELWTKLDGVGNLSIDLHWRLPGCNAAGDEVWSVLRRDARPVDVGGCRALTLSDAGLALHAALHLAQHGSDDPKAVADLRLALTDWPATVWVRAAALADELDAMEAFSAGLRLAPDGDRTADALGLGSGGDVRWDLEHRKSRPRGTFHLDALARAPGFSARLAIFRRALLPTPNWIRWEMRWAARSRAHLAVGYLMHLLRTPTWAAQAMRYRHRRLR